MGRAAWCCSPKVVGDGSLFAPVIAIDELFCSKQAKQSMLDEQAAMVILQTDLDRLRFASASQDAA
jgi:hypothetical protein